ncbi:MAG: oxidoreductase [Thermoprotei archaeon]|nr:MAG: oxidoreductase [Thermoprotei archaeon]
MNNWIPKLARIVNVRDETPDTRTFTLKFIDDTEFEFQPGQFIELMVFGYGEAPFSLTSDPDEKRYFELTIRKIGTVTSALFEKPLNSLVGVRGPFGRGWPLKKAKNRNLLIVAGGLGLAPLRGVIYRIIRNRRDFGRVVLFYGARTPADVLYKDELFMWRKHIEVYKTVDKADEEWLSCKLGYEGVVTILFDKISVEPEDTIVFTCGPPIMMYFVTRKLVELGFDKKSIFLSLERMMRCGMGICGHCTIGGIYVCKDGPVFSLEEVESLLEPTVEVKKIVP